MPSASNYYKCDTNLTANHIHNYQINIKRGKCIKCHEIPKFLTKLCNLSDPEKQHTIEHKIELLNISETDALASQPNHLLTILSLKQIFVLK